MPPTTEGSRSRILVADDQPDVLDALKFLLADEGFVVDTARSPFWI
jgi:CheY-like chemotaxis protein